jgi:hypothetical protein
LFFFRQQNKNRLYEQVIDFFATRAERDGLTKKDIAEILGKDPAQITRLLSGPGNWEQDTTSDLLYAMGGEIEYAVRDLRDLGPRNSQPAMVTLVEHQERLMAGAPSPASKFVVFTPKVTSVGSSTVTNDLRVSK